jgi:hypothetical protein
MRRRRSLVQIEERNVIRFLIVDVGEFLTRLNRIRFECEIRFESATAAFGLRINPKSFASQPGENSCRTI